MHKEEKIKEIVEDIMQFLSAERELNEELENHVINALVKYFDAIKVDHKQDFDDCKKLEHAVNDVLDNLNPTIDNIMIVYVKTLSKFSQTFESQMDMFDLFNELAEFMIDHVHVHNGKSTMKYSKIIEFYEKKYEEKINKEAA